jgi:xanthine dehydrogenase accessory factor
MNVRTTEFFEKLAILGRERQPFAVATVVARRAPISAHLGDRAIIYADGRMEGFVGGACAREIVRKQALELLRTRQARLVSIRPDAADFTESTDDHVVVPMSCASEGAVDVYIEPFVEAKCLVVVGATPVADALARAAAGLDYDVVRVLEASEQRDVQPDTASGIRVASLDSLADTVRSAGGDVSAVVASQGHYDEEALRTILGSQVAYVGLVASRKRWATIRSLLAENGVGGLDTVHNPAGIDLGARTSSEVAVSILAELIQAQAAQRPAGESAPQHPMQTPMTPPLAVAVDPVCGMQVDVAGAKHSANVDGTLYYFCCASCRSRFVKEPQPFLSARG